MTDTPNATQQKIDELERTVRLYRTAIEAAGAVPYCRNYHTNQYEFVGAGIEKLTGISNDEFTPQAWDDLIQEIVPAGEYAGLGHVEARRISRAEKRPVSTADNRIRTRGGEERWLACAAAEIRGEDGTSTRSIGIFFDITERKALESQVLRAQRMESIGTLAGGVAHNFNNILGIILGNVDLARLRLGETHEAMDYLGKIASASERAASLAQQLLSIARPRRSERAILDVAALVDDLSQALKMMLHSNLDVRWHTAKQVGQIRGCRVDIEQALMNILLNARDAMAAGGVIDVHVAEVEMSPTLYAAHEEMNPGRYVCISIADTGHGMDSETLANIFDPFFTTKGPDKGIGLGLTTSYATVTNHGGCIDVESEVGKGSTFHVYLPVARDVQHVKRPAETPELQKGTETILVVDDEECVADVMRQALKELGYVALTASEGKSAVDLFRRECDRIDLVLLDYVMPGLGGEDTYRELKKIKPDIKVVLTGGFDEADRLKSLLNSGVDGFIHKPFHLWDLSRSVRDALDKS